MVGDHFFGALGFSLLRFFLPLLRCSTLVFSSPQSPEAFVNRRSSPSFGVCAVFWRGLGRRPRASGGAAVFRLVGGFCLCAVVCFSCVPCFFLCGRLASPRCLLFVLRRGFGPALPPSPTMVFFSPPPRVVFAPSSFPCVFVCVGFFLFWVSPFGFGVF